MWSMIVWLSSAAAASELPAGQHSRRLNPRRPVTRPPRWRSPSLSLSFATQMAVMSTLTAVAARRHGVGEAA